MDFWTVVKIILAIILAFFPVLVWLDIIYYKKEKDPKTIAWIFLCGMLAVIPILGLQFLWLLKQNIDIYEQIQANIENIHLGFLATFVLVGVLEEITKFSVLRYVDHSKIEIQTINDSVKYAIVAALGFAFTENALYFSSFFLSEELTDIFINVSFRSIFTMCAHIIFAGIVGYYYSIGKFAKPILEQRKWIGEKYSILEKISHLLGIKKETLFRKQQIIKGLAIAILMHTSFNIALQYRLLDIALLLVALSFIYIFYLMRRKAAFLVFSGITPRKSLMDPRDEDVVIELIGMWLNEGKYKEVDEICERLLARDPDNQVVKIFRAQAKDKSKLDTAFRAIKALFDTNGEKMEEKSLFEEFGEKKEKNNEISSHHFPHE